MELINRTRRLGILLSSFVALVALPHALALASEEQSHGSPYSNFVELRIYTTHTGKRESFVQHFEKHYLSAQEQFEMRIWGQFRDLENPQQFVWIRGYRNMQERFQGLMGFYTSETWRSTSEAVREMMAQRATHVHFLEPVSDDSGFARGYERPGERNREDPGVIVIRLYEIDDEGSELQGTIKTSLVPAIERFGAQTLAIFKSSGEENNFPALSIIENENILVWVLSYPGEENYQNSRKLLDEARRPFETFVLQPGDRSRLVHQPAKN